MFTYYNLRRKKLSFSYAIPFNFTRDNDYYTGDSEYNLLKRRDYVLVRFLNGGDITIVYKPLTSKLETNIVCGNNLVM